MQKIMCLKKKPHQKTSRRARGGAENGVLLHNFVLPTMIYLIIKMKIIMKEESGFLITHSPLRPLRLCVMKFIRIPFLFCGVG